MAVPEGSPCSFLAYASLRMVTVASRSPVEKRPKISTIVASERGTAMVTETLLRGSPAQGTVAGSQIVTVKGNPLNAS